MPVKSIRTFRPKRVAPGSFKATRPLPKRTEPDRLKIISPSLKTGKKPLGKAPIGGLKAVGRLRATGPSPKIARGFLGKTPRSTRKRFPRSGRIERPK